MATLLERLKKVMGAIDLTRPRLALARTRLKRQLGIRRKAHRRAVKRSAQADEYRKQGHPKRAAYFDSLAVKAAARAHKAQTRAQLLIAQVKRLNQKLKGLAHTAAELRAELDALKKESGVQINGNHATGGTKRQRLKAVALAAAAACAAGRRRNFYSQSGTWDVDHAISGESYGHRSDCSSFVTSVYKAAGLTDPNRNDYRGGFTGTLVAHGRTVSRSDLKPGDLIIYGPGDGHHVEMYVGPGDKTIGHGSAPVDPGAVYQIPGTVRFRSYV
jgi:cell wall-associated NlpC family hydrolase